jgi:hypothetical protein
MDCARSGLAELSENKIVKLETTQGVRVLILVAEDGIEPSTLGL